MNLTKGIGTRASNCTHVNAHMEMFGSTVAVFLSAIYAKVLLQYNACLLGHCKGIGFLNVISSVNR